MHIDKGIFQFCMPQKRLEHQQIGSPFNVMGRKAVAKRVRADSFRQPCPYRGLMGNVPNRF